MIYLDNAATTRKKPQPVIRAVTSAMENMGNAGRGAHEAALNADRLIYDTREALCRFFHGEDPRQIVFTCNATESLNTAIRGLLSPGDHVVTTAMEHNSVLRPLYEMEEKGVKLTIVPADERGRVAFSDLEAALTPGTKMLVMTHASNLTGNVNDIEKFGEAAHEKGALFVVDAAQTAGFLPIDVRESRIDVLCFTGHKSMLGPQGTGGMYVRKGVAIRPLKSGGTGVQTYNKKQPQQMPTALEAGTLNGHGIAGLGAAVTYIEETGMEEIRKKEISLSRRFYEGVKDIPGITIYGDFSTWERCPTVSLNIGDYDSSEVSDELLTSYHISTRAGGHCAPLMHEALGTKERGAVRFSFSIENTEEETDLAIEAIRQLAEE